MNEWSEIIIVGLVLYLSFSFCSAVIVLAASMLSSLISRREERWYGRFIY